MKKKIKYFFILVAIIGIVTPAFWLWRKVNAKSTVISLDEISNIEVEKGDSILISGDFSLEGNERLQFKYTELTDDILYLFLTKTDRLIGKDKHFEIELIQPRHEKYANQVNYETVKQIVLLDGQQMLVENIEDPSRSYIEFDNYENSQIIWNE